MGSVRPGARKETSSRGAGQSEGALRQSGRKAAITKTCLEEVGANILSYVRSGQDGNHLEIEGSPAPNAVFENDNLVSYMKKCVALC